MAIFEEKAYGVQCDVCGKVYMNEYSGFTLWTDENSPKEEAAGRPLVNRRREMLLSGLLRY